jgi:hypothetical protein
MPVDYRPDLLLVNPVEAWQIAIPISFFGLPQVFGESAAGTWFVPGGVKPAASLRHQKYTSSFAHSRPVKNLPIAFVRLGELFGRSYI